MTVEYLVKRTIYVAECTCGETDVKDDNPPRERQCKCGQWVKYEPQSYAGPSTFDGRPEARRVGDSAENERNVGVKQRI